VGQALLECCWAAEEDTAGEGAAGMLLRMLLLLLYWEFRAPVDPVGPAKRLPVDPMLL